jgi:DNA polymerase III sliding clamp (beta) subunit (PCNA family)
MEKEAMSDDTPRVTRDEHGRPTIHVDVDGDIAAQLNEPAVRGAVEGVVRNVLGAPAPSDGFWADPPSGPAEPISFQTARKDLLHALTRTQHALSGDEDRLVLQSWWLTVEGKALVIHASDNYRVARATVSVETVDGGRFGIHRSEGKALLAFLASGPSDVAVDVAGGAWSVTHDEGRLAGRLAPGDPPDWSKVTIARVAERTVALNGRYVADAAKAATGESGVLLMDFHAPEEPALFRSEGYDEWIMPVRTPGVTP